MTGFTLNWFLKDINGTQLTEKLPPRQDDWKQEVPTPKYEQTLLAQMVQLARQPRFKDLTKEQIFETVVQQKVKDVKKLAEDRVCSLDQVKPENQNEALLTLDPFMNTNEAEVSPSDEEIQLFYALVYCPTKVIKLFRFIDQLLSNESERTIIQTVVNMFQSEVITDVKSFTLAKEFYFVLASTLNLQYGNVVLAISTKTQLQAAIKNDLPFFANNTGLVEKCLRESQRDGVQDIIRNLGIISFPCFT